VTRIIAGAAGGRRLAVPPLGTRPTSDRVREALFSSLVSERPLAGARVLDLYAGSGALGLEALSRGAAAVTLVDHDANVVRTLQKNVAAVRLPGAEVVRSTVDAFLRRRPIAADLVFIDPPYDLHPDRVLDVLGLLRDGWLAVGATVVVERSGRSPGIRWPIGYERHWNRRFGDTRLERAVWYGHEQEPR